MLKVNEYFDGKAKSIAFQTSTLPATVGVISRVNTSLVPARKKP